MMLEIKIWNTRRYSILITNYIVECVKKYRVWKTFRLLTVLCECKFKTENLEKAYET